MLAILSTLFGHGTWGAGGNLVVDIPAIIFALWHNRRQLHARLDRIEAALTGGTWSARAAPVPRSSTVASASPAPLNWDDARDQRDRRQRLTGG